MSADKIVDEVMRHYEDALSHLERGYIAQAADVFEKAAAAMDQECKRWPRGSGVKDELRNQIRVYKDCAAEFRVIAFLKEKNAASREQTEIMHLAQQKGYAKLSGNDIIITPLGYERIFQNHSTILGSMGLQDIVQFADMMGVAETVDRINYEKDWGVPMPASNDPGQKLMELPEETFVHYEGLEIRPDDAYVYYYSLLREGRAEEARMLNARIDRARVALIDFKNRKGIR